MTEKRITVYDATPADCRITAKVLIECFDRAGIEAVVSEFTAYEDFIYDFRDNYYDIAFVGIGSMLDLEAARGIRGLDENCPLFLISNITEYALEGFRINALDYIIKPVTIQRISEAVTRAGSVF